MHRGLPLDVWPGGGARPSLHRGLPPSCIFWTAFTLTASMSHLSRRLPLCGTAPPELACRLHLYLYLYHVCSITCCGTMDCAFWVVVLARTGGRPSLHRGVPPRLLSASGRSWGFPRGFSRGQRVLERPRRVPKRPKGAPRRPQAPRWLQDGPTGTQATRRGLQEDPKRAS